MKKIEYEKTVLCADVGATNTRLAVVGFKKDIPEILLIKHEPTDEILDFASFIQHALELAKKEHNLTPVQACFAVAGPIQGARAKLTNINLTIDTVKLMRQTTLTKVLLINDFTAVAYGVNVLQRRDTKTIQLGLAVKKEPIVIVGAGTGLGKSIIYYDKDKVRIPIASEGGDGDLPMIDPLEYRLGEFIKKKQKTKRVIYEDVLSGRGLENIYEFLQSIRYPRQPKTLSPEAISRTRKKNICGKEAFKFFTRLYARCCKNLALDALARGGVYVAGGIAAKNPEVFGKEFTKEFSQDSRYKTILKRIPIKLIRNQHVGLLGAAYAIHKGVQP